MFGEDYLCYTLPNTYSVKVESIKFSMLSIDKAEFVKKYRKMIKPLQHYFYKRKILIEKIINDRENHNKIIKKKFFSKVEKGKVNVYLMKDMRGHMSHANANMQKKIHTHFLKKTIEIDESKRPFTNNELKDIENFKDIMRG